MCLNGASNDPQGTRHPNQLYLYLNAPLTAGIPKNSNTYTPKKKKKTQDHLGSLIPKVLDRKKTMKDIYPAI